ncbi:hypothetical protein L1987_03356 [Smallanthus sonchifolius]|uniref:Uncharacterized protein n=1 Tax=Smallanthus sonchifolius TaxID=185202 RepID=A0ACB9KAJ4_9ASTR|nr:hypothetical protein L1987_03356 [Smallanthus sonchifolius]
MPITLVNWDFAWLKHQARKPSLVLLIKVDKLHFTMAKRSKRRQRRQNKDHAGCMWGLISIFDFRHGQTTRRLLSDRSIVTKDIVASEDPTSEVNRPLSSEERHVSIEDVTESEKLTVEVVKTSVKELMEEEMVSEQDSINQSNGDEVEKISNKPFGDHEISISCQDSSQKTSQYNDLEALMKELLLIYQRRNNHDLDEGQNHTFTIVEEKLSAAVEVFMNEKSSDRNQEKTKHSKDLIDTFQMLSSNKELFLKLLQDQASLNANEDQKSKSTTKSNQLENEPKLDVPLTRKHKNFFFRRTKSQENMPLSRIVILKPNSLENQFKVENEVQSERFSSHFSFMEIKRRLRNAIGKEQQKLGGNEKTVGEGNIGWSSPNRDHFYSERFTRGIERISKLKESEIKQRESDEIHGSSRHISNIYTEAKKHLSEMLSGGDEDRDLMMENVPKTLGKILSFPEYNSLSPGVSPRKENGHGNFDVVNESQPGTVSVDLEEKPKDLDEVNLDTCMGGTPSSMVVDMSPEGLLEIEKSENQEEMAVLDCSCEPCSPSERMDEIVDVSNEERSPKCLKLDSPEENEFSSPTGFSHSRKIEEPESTTSDKTERPSPVSVLEPLFSDNEISPASTISRPVEYAIQPLRIRFEDQEICTRNCVENEESSFEYVEAVLLASDLNWDEFGSRWISSMQILDSSLFDEVAIFSSRPSHDQRLLFDSTNEVLKEVCDCYLDFFRQLSFIKRKIQPVPKGADLINEVWERIELHLKDNYPLSLDQLVKKDLGISRTWMDLSSDSREIVFEVDESIFEDMMDDTLLSLVNDRVDNES